MSSLYSSVTSVRVEVSAETSPSGNGTSATAVTVGIADTNHGRTRSSRPVVRVEQTVVPCFVLASPGEGDRTGVQVPAWRWQPPGGCAAGDPFV